MMACALTGPMPLSDSSCSFEAVLMLTAATARPIEAQSIANSRTNFFIVISPSWWLHAATPREGADYRGVLALGEHFQAHLVEAGPPAPFEGRPDVHAHARGRHGEFDRHAGPALRGLHQPLAVQHRAQVTLHEEEGPGALAIEALGAHAEGEPQALAAQRRGV